MNNAKVTVCSFGFKYGVPEGVNLLIDVRFLPNPYYDESLRAMSGLDAPVRDFMESREETRAFCDEVSRFALHYIRGALREGKDVCVAFGCTGGRHRSVYFAQFLYKMCKANDFTVILNHIDINGDRNELLHKS